MSDNDARAEALEWAEESEDSKTLAITHALLYVGDTLADLCLEMNNRPAEQATLTPKLAALLAKASPLAEPGELEGSEAPEPSVTESVAVEPVVDGVEYGVYRKFPARHDPADWKKLPDGRWESPTGRKYGMYSRQVIGVVKARKKRGLPV